MGKMGRYYCPQEDVLLTEQEIMYTQLPSPDKIICRHCGSKAFAIAEDEAHSDRNRTVVRPTSQSGIKLTFSLLFSFGCSMIVEQLFKTLL